MLGLMRPAGLATAAWSPARALAREFKKTETMPRDRPIIINALGGIEDPNLALGRPQSDNPVAMDEIDIDARAIADARAGGLTAVNITLGYVGGPEEPYAYTLKTIDAWDKVLADHASDLMPVHTASDILKARDDNKIGIVYGFQNGAMVGNDPAQVPARVNEFASRGVRVFQLTYNPANQLGDGSMVPQNRGLTPLGRDAVAAVNGAKMMVDLSHSGENTCLDAARISKAPISINHTGCRALCDLPRNKTDAELRLVADGGGFVGIYFMPFLKSDSHPHAEDVVAHIDHAVNVCGEDHVGIGTDGAVTTIDDMEKYRGFIRKQIADRAAKGLGATGETPDTYPFVIDLRGVDQFRKLESLLKAKGYGETRIDKILGRNFLAFAKEIWG